MTPPVRHRRPPTIATTLAAAALAGELVVAALATAPPASAQTDEPPTADASAAPASEAPDSDPEPATPEIPDDAPPAEPPVDSPAPETAVPETPAAGPAPAAPVPVRTGYAPDLTSDPTDGRGATDAIPPSPERGTDDREPSVAGPAARTGHDASPATSTQRGGRAPARRRHGAHAPADRRAQRAARPRTLPGAPPAGAAPTEHTIAPGEHLWGIAAASFAELTARPVSSLRAEEIAPYWARLCMLNAARLRSGNLNVVYPGEVVELPPL